jgi:DNA-directed RNA polymerase II subunit RPB1
MSPSSPKYCKLLSFIQNASRSHNLHRIIQNATQIFHIENQKPSDLEPAYIVEAVQQLNDRLAVVIGDDPLTREVQANSSLTFRMHMRATLAARHVLEQFHLTREAFGWVLAFILPSRRTS